MSRKYQLKCFVLPDRIFHPLRYPFFRPEEDHLFFHDEISRVKMFSCFCRWLIFVAGGCLLLRKTGRPSGAYSACRSLSICVLLRNTFALVAHHVQYIPGVDVSLIGRLTIPFYRLEVVLWNTYAEEVIKTQMELGIRNSL